MKVVRGLMDSRCSSGDWVEGDGVAKAFESADEVAFGAASGEPVEVGVAEVLVGSAQFEHVIDDHEDFAGHRHGRSGRNPRRALSRKNLSLR